MSTGEGSGQVPEKGSGEYRKMTEFGQVPKKGPGEYRKMVESGRVSEKGIKLGRDAEEPPN